ncbi:MAG: DDE-type integrase/transposase/recombinase [Promethearchaeota archaeon]
MKDGKIDTALLCEILGSSPSTISNLLRYIVEKVATHPKTELFWESPINGEAVYIDETFIKILRKTWYLIVFLSEKGNVLAFELVEKRSKEKILELFKKAEQRLGKKAKMMITDDFQVYKSAATDLGRDMIHVRHIHSPPYGRIVVDMIEHREKEIITRHYATSFDILLDTNTFIV